MADSPLDDVALEGARHVTARWLIHGIFEEELVRCRHGTVPQRKGVAQAAVYLLHERRYSRQCRDLLRHFNNDSDKEVRDELRDMFRRDDLLSEPEHRTFLQQYLRSQAFADDPGNFIWDLKEFPGSLVPVAEAIFTVCEEFATTLKEKIRDTSTIYPHTALEISSILLRLYEQAQDERNKQITDRSLDIWDLLFENRVGEVIDLTRSIEK